MTTRCIRRRVLYACLLRSCAMGQMAAIEDARATEITMYIHVFLDILIKIVLTYIL